MGPIDRTELRRAYRPDEEQVARERINEARLTAEELGEATAMARALVKGVRSHKPSGVDAFLHAYDLGSDEGIAMMCLAEALLRIPDAHTADLDAAARGLMTNMPLLNIPQPPLPQGEGGSVAEAPVSRNAPCPCGSGKKYKHCHGQLA